MVSPMARVLLEEMTSVKGTCKAQIWRRDDGMIHIQVLRWTTEVVSEQEGIASSWAEVTTAGSITDSMSIARGLANALVERHS